jgi:hypothetical protein
MWWIVAWALVILIGVAGLVTSLNSVRFGRRIARDARELAATSAEANAPVRTDVRSLPAPVQRYLGKALGDERRMIAHVRVRHGGLFRPSLKGGWMAIRGDQHFNANPPGFVWWGRVKMGPGLWIDARDRSISGAGHMLVTLDSTLTMADSEGPELDQGALLRLLGEMAWFPTAFMDARYVRWSPVDDRRAAASLDVNGRTVNAQFEFGVDDLVAAFQAQRYRDVGGGKSALTPFVGRVSDYRRVDGVLVPFRVIGAWTVDGETIDYVNFTVDEISFEWTALP